MYADFNYLYVQAYQIPRQQSVSSQTPIFFNSQREDKRLCHLLQYFLRMSPLQDLITIQLWILNTFLELHFIALDLLIKNGRKR